MLDDKSISAIGDLYDAALKPRGWVRGLSVLTKLLEGNKAALLAQNRITGDAKFVCSHGFDHSAIESYEQYYGKISVLFQDARRKSLGALYTDEMYPDYVAYQKSEIYNDYFKPNKIDHLMQSYIAGDDQYLMGFVLRRDASRSFFGAGTKRLFGELVPHIRRAYALTERIGEAKASRHVGLAALEAMNSGILLVDGSGKLCSANVAGERILANCDGLGVWQGRLVTAHGEETQRLRHLISAAASFGRRPDVQPGGEMAVCRPSGKRSLLLSIAPVGTQGYPDAPGRATAMITITDPEEQPALPCEMLRSLFGLTPAEARLAAEMATGDSLEHIAERLGVTRESARTTLKRVYDKTDTHRQAELVRLLLSVPSLRRL